MLVHRDRGPPPRRRRVDEAVRQAGAERYRPILMTTLATVAGMLPLALLGGEGVELRRSLALAVIGGMTPLDLRLAAAGAGPLPLAYPTWER